MVECLFSDNFSDGDMSDWQLVGNAETPAVEVDGTMVISRVVVQKTKAQGCGCKNRVVKVW